MLACGLCGTDHEQYTGELAGGFAFVPGHETVGIIDTIGPRAAQRWGVAAGDRVAVEVFQSCRDCKACVDGEYRRCERHGLADMYGFISVDPRTRAVGWLRRISIPGAGFDGATCADGTRPGRRHCVQPAWGWNPLGLCAAAAARDAGAEFVMMTGLGARDADRLALASRFGADLVADVAVDDPVAALRDATGGLADVVVDVTAKAPAAFAQAIELARTAGTVVVAGTRKWGTGAPGFVPDMVVLKELRIVGALGGGGQGRRRSGGRTRLHGRTVHLSGAVESPDSGPGAQ